MYRRTSDQGPQTGQQKRPPNHPLTGASPIRRHFTTVISNEGIGATSHHRPQWLPDSSDPKRSSRTINKIRMSDREMPDPPADPTASQREVSLSSPDLLYTGFV